jgi:hypothetical protein
MNLRIALPLLFALGTTTSFAQDERDQHQNRNYLRGGYHISDLAGDENYDTRAGFYAGYHHTVVKAPLLGLSLGLEYNTAGASREQFEWKGGYLGIPANARLKLGPTYLDGGLSVAYLVTDKAFINGNEAEKFDVLAHAGAGFKVLFISFEVRYRYGFLEVVDNYRNTGLQLGMSVFL